MPSFDCATCSTRVKEKAKALVPRQSAAETSLPCPRNARIAAPRMPPHTRTRTSWTVDRPTVTPLATSSSRHPLGI